MSNTSSEQNIPLTNLTVQTSAEPSAHIHEDETNPTHTHDSSHTHTDSTSSAHAEHTSQTHAHDSSHTHAGTGTHGHYHANTKAVLNRMSRAIGHMEAVKTMIEDGRDCSEVLIQIAAVRSAINNIGKIILEDHINHCVVDAIETGDQQVLRDLNDAINKFIK